MPSVTLTVVNSGHNLLRDGLGGANTPKITYFALGTNNTAVVSTQTRLLNEVFRKKVTSVTNGASVGEVLINVYVAPGDAVGMDIEEIGVFGGNSAKGTANSGVMLGRALWSHNPKTNLESVQLQLDATV